MRHAKLPTTAVRIGVVVAALLAITAVSTGGAAAADPADFSIAKFQPGVNVEDSGPLPSDLRTNAVISVENESGGQLNSSEVSFGGVEIVGKEDDYPPHVKAMINRTNIPSDGVTVDISVSDTYVGSVDVLPEVYDTKTVDVSQNMSKNVENVTLEIDVSELNDSDFATKYRDNFEGTRYEYRLWSDFGDVPESTEIAANQSNTVNKTISRSGLPEYKRAPFDQLFGSNSETTLYLPDYVESVKIDGETVSMTDAPLGGGGGSDGLGDQTLIAIGVAVVAILLLTRD
jgi:hypothetical protein